MNRRNFLKSLAAACGAAIVCPGELLKSPVKHLWMRGKDGSYIEGIKIPWIHLYTTYHYTHDELIKAYRGQYYETTET